MSCLDAVKRIMYIDDFVRTYRAEEERKTQRGIAFIAAIVFAVMCLVNLRRQSFTTLATTSFSSLFLFIGYLFNKYKNSTFLLNCTIYIIYIVVFTTYMIEGGTEGFSILWVITATYSMMLAVSFKGGVIIGIYYLITLVLVFVGPLSSILQYEYNEIFRLRFPFLYAANFLIAIYLSICVRKYQYELLLKQQELEYFSATDLSTGLKNRNNYIQYEQSFSGEGLQSLVAVFIDVNGLHEINNLEGHAAGDRMLRYVADLCQKHFPGHDCYRMGGDEFLILCKNYTEKEVMPVFEKLFAEVERAGYSISYGIASQEPEFDLDQLVKCADEKMIQFKKEYYERGGMQGCRGRKEQNNQTSC